VNVSVFSPAFCSEGTIENSPAFQCRDGFSKISSPAGTAEASVVLSGLNFNVTTTPALKRRAIFKMSLRDTAFLVVQNWKYVPEHPARGNFLRAGV